MLREDVTAAIRTAVFEELAESGYGRMSIEAVARRAGVGKTAVYRRWPGKAEMVVDLVSAVAVEAADLPDTGSLLGDVTTFLEVTAQGLLHPLVWRTAPDLLAAANRTPELADRLVVAVRDRRRAKAAATLRRAIERGELPDSIDIEMALDLLAGPLFIRLFVVRGPVDRAYFERLARSLVAAIAATAPGG